jgi:hypothetical protein
MLYLDGQRKQDNIQQMRQNLLAIQDSQCPFKPTFKTPLNGNLNRVPSKLHEKRADLSQRKSTRDVREAKEFEECTF